MIFDLVFMPISRRTVIFFEFQKVIHFQKNNSNKQSCFLFRMEVNLIEKEMDMSKPTIDLTNPKKDHTDKAFNHREMMENKQDIELKTFYSQEKSQSQGPSRTQVKKNPLKKLEPSYDSSCTCTLKLGIYPLTNCEPEYSKVLDDIDNTTINFHGPAGSSEHLKVKEKINKIKETIAEFYYDKNCQVIAIPNDWTIPKKPSVIGLPNRESQDEEFLNKHCEELLHHEIVRFTRETKMECLVMNGFNSQDCLKVLLKKAKNDRGKNMFAALNKFENEIKNILDIKDISEEELTQTIEEHVKWKEGELNKKNVKSWLFKQGLIFYIMHNF